MSRYRQEWQLRKVVMEAILDLLGDGKPRTAWQILHGLPFQEGIRVKSIAFSFEAKRYVFFGDRIYFAYARQAKQVTRFHLWDLVAVESSIVGICTAAVRVVNGVECG